MVSSSTTVMSDGSGGSKGTFKVTFEVRNDESDDIEIAKSAGASQYQGFTATFVNGNNTPFSYSGMNFTVVPQNASVAQGNSFIIRSGAREKFTVTGVLDPSVPGTYRMKLTGVQVGGPQGSVITIQPGINGPVQTQFISLQ